MNYIKQVGAVNSKLKELLISKNFVEARDFMQLFNNENTDSSVLRILLILTKHFSEEVNIMDVRSQIKSILEKRRGKKLI